MNNRLKDFHTLMREADNAPRDTAAVLTVHAGAEDEDLVIEVDNSKPKEGFDNDDLESFYGLISQIKLNCYKLRQKTKDYEQAAEGMLGVMGREKIKKEQEDLNQIQEDASTIIHSTKDTFDKIQDMCQARSIDVSPEKLDDPEMDFKQPEDRMIVSAKVAASKNWYDAVQEYTECDTRFSRQFRELHKRHYRELHDGADPTDEELDDQEGQRADIFAEAMTSEADKRMAQSTYFMARHKEEMVNQIYEAQLENRDLWASLGLAIEHHGEILNNIYANVEKAQVFVKDGNKNLAEVSSLRGKSNKCRCFVLLGLTVIAAAVIVPTVATTS